MRSRVGVIATCLSVTFCTVCTACAAVIGLEDAHLERGNIDGGGADAPSSGNGGRIGEDATAPNEPSDAADGATPDTGVPVNACDVPGPAVYSFTDGADGWRYSKSSTPPTGAYSSAGVAFHLASESVSGATTADLYEIVNGATGDAALTVVPTEGSGEGYGPTLVGKIYLSSLPGTVEISRYYRESPTRHRIFRTPATSAETAGWSAEPNKTWYVCP